MGARRPFASTLTGAPGVPLLPLGWRISRHATFTVGRQELDGQVICEAAGRRLPGSASRDSLYNTCHHSYVDEDSK
uniref:Uncharacterized protein n=1 Tax=Triticum urartu TaxID=4572 RepID=A0A8R7JZ35_TRIUA